MAGNDLLRKIPKVDEILAHHEWKEMAGLFPEPLAKEELRLVLDEIRVSLKAGGLTAVPSVAEIIRRTTGKLRQITTPGLKRVVNGTGVIIHTNLGRSLLSRSAVERILTAASYYTNLEYDLEKGERGDRYTHCRTLLTRLTGAESALVVNNNAAAVYLVLNTLAEGKEAVVSRGELVEIGGSFRIPDVMRKSGVLLREVGTTNRTYVEDYEEAINENTALLTKIHSSNFTIRGFTHSPAPEELVALGRKHKIPTYLDAGSGLFFPLSLAEAHDEPCTPGEVRKGFDIVSGSGDKLLGGPQAGIIVGKKAYIDALKKNPLTRALRPDKLTLAGLEGTLLAYFDPERAKREIPTMRMIFRTEATLKEDAERLKILITEQCAGIHLSIINLRSEVGGGTLPDVTIPSYGIALKPEKMSIDKFERGLRLLETPVIGRIEKDAFLLDMRTLHEEDETFIVTGIEKVLRNG